MRTRFLVTDYFNSVPMETLEFLHCPLPHLPPSKFSILEELQNCFHDVSVLCTYLEIEKLPIEASLSKFLSDVLPQFIDADIGDFADDQSCSGTACSQKSTSFSTDHLIEIDASQENNERASVVLGANDFELIQFEIPEKCDVHCQKENMTIFSEIHHVESKVDMPSLRFRMLDIFEIQQADYSVDSVLTEYFMEEKADLLEDSCSAGGQLGSSDTRFPAFEIDEASLGIFNDISVEDELISFENIQSQKWTLEDELRSNKENLGFEEFDLLLYLSNHCSAMQCPALKVTCSTFFQEIGFTSHAEDSDIGQMSLCHQGTPQDSSKSIILFEAFRFTDLELYNFFELFYDLATVGTVEACDPMFSEALEFKNFNDLIVCNELILIDDSFKSLPVPILLDNQKTRSLHSFIGKILSEMEPESSFTYDGLYLDWNVLEEDDCEHNRYSSCWKMLEEIDTYSIDSALNIFDDGMLVLDFVLSGGSPDKPNFGEKKEILNVVIHGISVPPISRNEVASQKLLDDGHRNGVTGELSSEIGPAKVYTSVESMAEFSDLDLLLNPRECTRGRNCKPSDWSIHINTALPAVSSGDSISPGAATQVSLQQWNIKMLQVELSDEILALIDSFRKSFLGILQNDVELMKALHPYQGLDDLSFLRLRKEDLMDRIKKISASRTPSAHTDENVMSLVALCAIKQMVWYLCYYGLHTTQLYIDKLSSSMQCLKSRLSFLRNLIEDKCRKGEKEVIKFHPSLSVVQEVLQSSFSEIGQKVLIVAEPFFWWPLKRLLTSMKISYNEPQCFWTNTYQHDGYNEFTDATSTMFQSDCCLVSHEYLSASFPFDKFGIILEYGGSHKSSRVCSISTKLVKHPCLYFLKVQLDDLGVPKAICDGVDVPKIPGRTMKGDPLVASVLNESITEMEELLNFMPVEEYNDRVPTEAVYGDEDCPMKPVHSQSFAMDTEEIHTNKTSSPDRVIVVNTQNFDKEMVISRRSTYQKILAMEKGGAQVVERDLNIPVDVIVNAAICLAWYDLQNIGKKASAPDEAFSCLPLCVENIAASILTSLSFAFSSCILVFEGEKDFLAGVMESSDELYAAAASLGIDLQIFCSYSPLMTDETIISCIEAVTKLTRGLYPKMSDSECLAESFLTAFPSMNPLSAHAILSSGGTLLEFLQWSHDFRIHAVQKYKIPDQSVALLGLLCQYGECEDSKSGMTDSSSTVSYVPDRFQQRSNCETRKRRCIENLHSVDTFVNEFSHIDPRTKLSDVRLNTSRSSVPLKLWMAENSEIIDECRNPGLPFDDKLSGQSRKMDADMTMHCTKVSSLYGFEMAEGHPTSEESKQLKNPWDEVYFGAKGRLEMAARNNSCSLDDQKSKNHQEDLIGEVIDLDVSAAFRNDISKFNTLCFSPCEVEKQSATGISRNARKLSFGASSLITFPTPAANDSDSDMWIPKHESISRKGNKNSSDSYFSNYKFSAKHQKGFFHEDMLLKTALNSSNQPLQEKDSAQCGGTPLWNAIHSSQPLRESPWTIEFLNRIKEKSRILQKSLPSGLSAPFFGSPRNKPNAGKRRSPSILEYYKYQRDGVPKKTIQHKRQKQSVKPSSLSKNDKASDSILPTWTPVDKRAKQSLSFATIGNRGQSKLIWSDKNLHH